MAVCRCIYERRRSYRLRCFGVSRGGPGSSLLAFCVATLSFSLLLCFGKRGQAVDAQATLFGHHLVTRPAPCAAFARATASPSSSTILFGGSGLAFLRTRAAEDTASASETQYNRAYMQLEAESSQLMIGRCSPAALQLLYGRKTDVIHCCPTPTSPFSVRQRGYLPIHMQLHIYITIFIYIYMIVIAWY